MTAPPAAEKQALRAVAMARRDGLDGEFRCRAARRAILHILRLLPMAPESAVAAYWPIGCELDTRPLLAALAALDITVCLPRIVGRERPLVFHCHQPGDPLLEGPMRVLEPLPESPIRVPDIVIVPLLAFDGEGYRLGYGGGFYDRTLAALGPAITAIGIGFEAQRLALLPREPNDVRLAAIVTEAGARHFS